MLRFFLLAIVLMGGCSSPQIVNKNDKIGVRFDGGELVMPARKIATDSVVLDGIIIDRALYKAQEENIVYEEARVQPPYLLNYATTQTLHIVFDTLQIEQLEQVGNLWFYKVRMRNGSAFYLVAQNRNSRGLVLLYGLSSEQMEAIIAECGGKKIALSKENDKTSMALPASEQAFMSRWNPKMIILDGLLKRLDGKPIVR